MKNHKPIIIESQSFSEDSIKITKKAVTKSEHQYFVIKNNSANISSPSIINNESGVSLAHNATWIDRVYRAGVKVVDIGIDAGAAVRSPYYSMEWNALLKWFMTGIR